MTYSWWDAAKDFAGAIGPLFIAVPWLQDFFVRLIRMRLSKTRVSGKLAILKGELENTLREKIEHPKARDFGWTVLGLACIALSFTIAFVRGVPDLF